MENGKGSIVFTGIRLPRQIWESARIMSFRRGISLMEFVAECVARSVKKGAASRIEERKTGKARLGTR